MAYSAFVLVETVAVLARVLLPILNEDDADEREFQRALSALPNALSAERELRGLADLLPPKQRRIALRLANQLAAACEGARLRFNIHPQDIKEWQRYL